MRHGRRATSFVAACLVFTACSGTDGEPIDEALLESSTTTTRFTETTVPPSSSEPGPVIVTTLPDPTSAPTAPLVSDDAVRFVDPDGTYEMQIGATWMLVNDADRPDRELWFFDADTGANADSLRVETASVGGTTLEQYVNVVKTFTAQTSGEQVSVSEQYVDGVFGQPLAIIERSNGTTGTRSLDVFVVQDGTAVVATLTTSAERFDERRSTIEPLLLTLVAF